MIKKPCTKECTKSTTIDRYCIDNGRIKIQDKQINENIEEHRFKLINFIGLVAIKITFKKVDFSNCIFESVYLRNCRFIDCDFTGVKFVNSNLLGSGFSGCTFKYATFEKTVIDNDIFEKNLPKEENLQRKLLRSLRVNYQQLGDTANVNKTIILELHSTGVHLKKSWLSEESYYRMKYQGFNRIKMFLDWLVFAFLDKVWGNGESVLKLFRAILFIFLFIAVVDISVFSTSSNSIVDAFLSAPSVFFGVSQKYQNYPDYYKVIIFVVRLTMFALFISIILKRLNRR